MLFLFAYKGGEVMANEENLKPFSERTPRERSELGRKGAKAANKKKKEKKLLKDHLLAWLDTPGKMGNTKLEDMTIAIVKRAIEDGDGNNKAWEIIRDTIGQKPKEQMEVETTTVIKVELDDE